MCVDKCVCVCVFTGIHTSAALALSTHTSTQAFNVSFKGIFPKFNEY